MLSNTGIKGAKPKEKNYKIADEKGMFLFIKKNNSKYFRLDYRFNGKRKTLALGIYPETTLKQAREKRDKAKSLIANGIDPTGADVHIGHLVPIRKMREFQDLGHTGVIIIGDFTAQIGDPTGKDESRPPLTAEDVKKNAEKYMDQLYMILDLSLLVILLGRKPIVNQHC